jgi:hypothetical protein
VTTSSGAGYRRWGLALVLLAAAAPYRVYGSFPVVASVSVLDAALLLAAAGMLLQMSMQGGAGVGDPRLFRLLCVAPVMSAVSALWSQDLAATVRDTLSYAEGIVAYVYTVRQTRGLPPEVVVGWLRRFACLLLVPSLLMYLHVPGFAPEEPGLGVTTGDYISYFTRLSHPFIGRSNNLASVLAMVVVVLFYWGTSRHDRASSRVALLTTVAIVLTVSRGVILALVLAGILHLATRTRPRRPPLNRRTAARAVAVLTVVAAAAWSFYLINPDTRLYISGRLSLSNVLLRETRFSDGFAKLGDRPFLGFGSGVLPDSDLSIAGGVHDTYLQQLLAYGVVLGLVVVVSLVEVARYFFQQRESGLSRAIGLTVVAQLVIFAVEASFEGALLRVLTYLLLGMLVGLLREDERDRAERLAPMDLRHA